MSVVGELSVEITADAAGLKRGVNAASNALKKGSVELRKSVNQYGKWAIGAAAAAATVATAVTKAQLSNIKDLKILSDAGNTSVQSFQRQAFAAEQAGISQEKYGDILKDMTERVGEFTNRQTGPLVDFFENIAPKVGITADAFRDLSGPDALQLFVTSLEKANVSQQEMTTFMEEVAGDSIRLLPLLRNNGKEMAVMAEEARLLGVGLSDIEVEQAIEANKQIAKLTAVMDSQLKQLVVELAPLITEVSKQILEMIKSGEGISGVSDVLKGAVTVVGVFANGLHGIQIIAKGLEIGFRGTAMVITEIFSQLTQFAKMLSDKVMNPIKDLLDLASEIPGIGDKFAGMRTQLEKFQAVQESNTQAAMDFAQAQVEAVEIAKKEFQSLALEKLPSEQYEQWFADIEAKAAESSAKIKENLSAAPIVPEGGSTPAPALEFPEIEDMGESPQLVRAREETKLILENLGFRQASQKELLMRGLTEERELLAFEKANRLARLNQDLLAEQELIAQDFEAGKLSEFERAEQMIELKRAEKEQIRNIEQDHADEMVRIKDAEEQAKRRIVESNIKDGIKILLSGSKKAQEIQKKAAIINAIVKGKEAAVDAWQAGMSIGGPWAPLAAAAYATASIAKTGAMINSIRSGGSSSGGGGGGASGAAAASQGGSAGQGGGGGQQAAPQAARTVDVRFSGSGLLNTDQVRELIGQINEQVGDGVDLTTG